MSQFADSTNLGLSFIVKNNAPQKKSLKVFNNAIPNGSTIDLAKIPGISIDDIKASVLKGEVGQKLQSKYLTFISTTIDFGSDHADGTYAGLLTSMGITTVPRKTSQTTWYVSPAAGSDTNTGLLGSPLKTLRELGRRLSADLPRDLTTVNILDNVTDANDFFQIMSRLDPQGALNPSPVAVTPGTGPTAPVALKIKGTRITASFTDPNTSSTTALTMTSDATPPQALATTIDAASDGYALPQSTINVASTTGFPTSGRICVITSTGESVVTYTGTTSTTFTGCTGGTGTLSTGNQVSAGLPTVITVSGFNFTPHIGRFVEILTSPVSAAVGMVGVIFRAPSTGVAHLSPLTGVNTHANLASASYVGTNTSTFRIYTTTTWAPHISPGFVPTTQINYEDIEFTSTTLQNLSNTTVGFEGCTIRRPIRPSASGDTQLNLNACSIIFSAPPGGRSPTQLQITNGEFRIVGSAFINVDVRVREGNARFICASCVAAGTCFNFGGPNDGGRAGSLTTFTQGLVNNFFGLGIYDWPAPDLLAPAPATTRGSTGAAVTIGHGAHVIVASRIYGESATANTVYFRVREGGKLFIADNMTDETSPVNPSSPGAAFVALSLAPCCGTLGQVFLDEPPTTGATTPFTAPTHINESNLRGVLNGTVPAAAGNFTTLTTFAEWRANFSRNCTGIRTGAAILNIAS